jgi:excisionase family DNA binding protein
MSPSNSELRAHDLLTARQVADRLSVSVRTVWRLVARGDFPKPIRVNCRLVRWKAEEVDRYIAGLTTRPAAS